MGTIFRNTVFVFHGMKHFGREGFLRQQRKFDESCMQRDLAGRVCMVTGANQGIGFQVSQELAQRGATLYMVCRNEERGTAAADRITAETGNKNVKLRICDVSDLESIRKLYEEFDLGDEKLHLLVNNAGVLIDHDGSETSASGLEINFAVNTLGTYAMSRVFQPILKKCSPARIINVSSGGMYTQPLVVADMVPAPGAKVDGSLQYARDKRRQVVLSEKMATLWAKDGIEVYSMHPGWVETEGVKGSIPGFYKTFQKQFRSLSQGADTILWLAMEDSAKLEPGGFYLDRKLQTKHFAWSGTRHKPVMAEALWNSLAEMAGLDP